MFFLRALLLLLILLRLLRLLLLLLFALLLLRPLRWLGEISYSLYMSHALVLWCARQVLRVVLHQPPALPDGSGSQLSPLGAALVYRITF